MVDVDRLRAAADTVRCDLAAMCDPAGCWRGDVADSPAVAAAVVSGIALYLGSAPDAARQAACGTAADSPELGDLMLCGVRWLAKTQGRDGGWPGTAGGSSTLTVTMLVRAAFQLAGAPAEPPDLVDRADAFILAAGGVSALRRAAAEGDYLAYFVLVAWALAGLLPWSKVPDHCRADRPADQGDKLPPSCAGGRLPEVEAAKTARAKLVRSSRLPGRLLRRAPLPQTSDLGLPGGGVYEERLAVALAMMCRAASGRLPDSLAAPLVTELLAAIRHRRWAPTAGHSVENTALAAMALAALDRHEPQTTAISWLLALQAEAQNPYTLAPAGGWPAIDRPEATALTSSTAIVVRALAAAAIGSPQHAPVELLPALELGLAWLIAMQNDDGGFPPAVPGLSGELAESSVEATALVLRALAAGADCFEASPAAGGAPLVEQLAEASATAVEYLVATQGSGGAWQSEAEDSLSGRTRWVVTTSLVVSAIVECGHGDHPAVTIAIEQLLSNRLADGGWSPRQPSGDLDEPSLRSGLEETAAAVEALLLASAADVPAGEVTRRRFAALRGLRWLVDAVEMDMHHGDSTPRRSFAKLEYRDRLWPMLSVAGALALAISQNASPIAQPLPAAAGP